jgi:hypothetical protein
MNAAVIPESIAQLQLQLDQIRSTQPRGKKLPDSVWQAAVELAREHGVYSVVHHLRLHYAGLKKRLGGVSHRRRKTRKPTFVELFAQPSGMQGECLIEFESLRGSKVLHSVESCHIARLDEPAAGLAGNREMIQITPQMRVVVAIERVDGRKGLDSLVRLCQEKLAEDPFSGRVFVFRSCSGLRCFLAEHTFSPPILA